MALKASVLLVALLGVAAVAASSDAHACGGFYEYPEVRPVRPKPVPVAANVRIPRAVERLEEEKPTEAATEVVTAFPTIRDVPVGASPLETRGQHVLALAVVRGEGTLAGVRGFSGKAAAERGANLKWATSVLKSISAERRDDPVALADFAEALAASGKDERALAILGDLAERDLLGSAHAYAVLARLRAARGDTASSRSALARCELMTRTPAVVCKATDGRLAARE